MRIAARTSSRRCARPTSRTRTAFRVEEGLDARGGGGPQRPLTSASRLSATATGRGSLLCAASSAVVSPVSTSAPSRLRALRRLDVGLEPVAHDERAALAEALERREEELRLGLADDRRLAAARRLHGGQHGAGARPEPVWHRVGGVAARSQEVGAALQRQAGGAHVVVGRPPRCPTRPRGRRAWRGRCCSSPSARRRATWSTIAWVPITNDGHPAAGLGEQVLHRAADGDDVAEPTPGCPCSRACARSPRPCGASCSSRRRVACRRRVAARSPRPSRRPARRRSRRSRPGRRSAGRSARGGGRGPRNGSYAALARLPRRARGT